MNRIASLLLALGLLAATSAFADEGMVESTGKNLKQMGNAAKTALKEDGKAVDKSAKMAGESTVEGIKSAGVWLGKKLETGGEKLEKASK